MAVKQQFNSFEELLAGVDKPLLVDFYAPWCGPCQIMAGVLERVSPRLEGKVRIVKINTDNYPHLASQYQISALPTLILFRDRQPVRRLEGAMTDDRLLQEVLTTLNAHA
ncbi:MAG: thioredoxin [Pseudanabaenaceae cyanobacterium]